MREIERRALEAFRSQFDHQPAVLASAPGRVNLIGEHTDYNGGFVLPCAIDRRVAIAASAGEGSLYSSDLEEAGSLGRRREGQWTDYPSGVVWALEAAGYRVEGLEAAFAGDVPLGGGLSSSAAIEAATAVALDALFDLTIARKDLALLCQKAENQFVGVNSGIMDQYASLLCREGAALLVDCRSLEARLVPLDLEGAGLRLLVCDTRVERRLAATGYNERRASCERAARALGVEQLRDATTADLERLQGEDLKRARHVVSENQRVLEAVAALEGRDYVRFGHLMVLSHLSLRDDYEVSTPELDTFVEVALEAGALGARLTGAGFGGCAIALVAQDREESVVDACRGRFRERGFKAPLFYSVYPAAGAGVVAWP